MNEDIDLNYRPISWIKIERDRRYLRNLLEMKWLDKTEAELKLKEAAEKEVKNG